MTGHPKLSASQLERALAVTRELAELRDLGQFPHWASRLVRQLIPCDHAGYNALDLASGRATVVADPAEVVFEGGPEALGPLAHQNPVIVRAQSGDRSVLRLSDFISRSALHATELYNEVYRVSSLEYQLAVQLPSMHSPGQTRAEVVGLSAARSHRDFTDGDRALLAAVVGHFAATLERLHELALLQTVVREQRDDTTHWVVLIEPREDCVAWVSPTAAAALQITAGDPLPASLRMWVRGERARLRHSAPAKDSVILMDGRRLRPTLTMGVPPDLDALHLAADARPDAPTLCRLGLTKRQAEVHALALEGYTSQQIADRLFLSRRTVEKHFEAIYQRLGVNNRAQAVAGTLHALHAVT